MRIPLSYSIRNLWTRRLTTVLTVSGMALVVFVYSAILMLAQGLEKTLVETGTDDNVVVIRKSSTTEVQSGIERTQAAIVESVWGIATDSRGMPLIAKEAVVLITLTKRGSDQGSNVTIRGITPQSLRLRPQVRLVEGRMPKPGSTEIMVGESIVKRFQGAGLQNSLRFGMREWRIVGVFDAGSTGFSSEIWGDVDQLMQAFRRPVYSSIIFRLQDPARFAEVRDRIEKDPRLTLEAKRETRYYLEQSEMMAKFLRILGISLTIIFSLGAMIGAMITMYAAVATRTAEIGTMRALGFQRRSILVAFLLEALFLGFCGGITGLIFASLMQFISISTVNFQTFSELAFSFTLTPAIAAEAIIFALVMGFLGGVLPAVRAARMNIVVSLRAT
jgi:putative ABC transport system permease protein